MGETIDKFVNILVKLCKMYSFCDCLHDELIQDCIVIGVCMDPTWKRLPAKKKLILKTATDIAESDKSAESHLNEKKAEDTGKKEQHYCGTVHLMRKERCPAWGKICSQCLKFKNQMF